MLHHTHGFSSCLLLPSPLYRVFWMNIHQNWLGVQYAKWFSHLLCFACPWSPWLSTATTRTPYQVKIISWCPIRHSLSNSNTTHSDRCEREKDSEWRTWVNSQAFPDPINIIAKTLVLSDTCHMSRVIINYFYANEIIDSFLICIYYYFSEGLLLLLSF